MDKVIPQEVRDFTEAVYPGCGDLYLSAHDEKTILNDAAVKLRKLRAERDRLADLITKADALLHAAATAGIERDLAPEVRRVWAECHTEIEEYVQGLSTEKEAEDE